MKKISKPIMRINRSSRSKVSTAALANFLANLADLYDVKESGNPGLADALRDLVKSIRRKSLLSTECISSESSVTVERSSFKSKSSSRKSAIGPRSKISTSDMDAFRKFDEQEIRKFLADETKTKDELLELASARFSIPISQLKRLRISEVRETVLSALLHESSIEILSVEAKREGNSRSS